MCAFYVHFLNLIDLDFYIIIKTYEEFIRNLRKLKEKFVKHYLIFYFKDIFCV